MGESSMTTAKDESLVTSSLLLSAGKRRALGIAAGVAIMVTMTCISYVTARCVMPQAVTFDMKGTMDAFIRQSAQQQLDEEKAQRLTSRFNSALNASLTDWQAQHQALILVKAAVVSTRPDITAEIQADIARRMQEGQ